MREQPNQEEHEPKKQILYHWKKDTKQLKTAGDSHQDPKNYKAK
jgi:hypothetical protein